MARAPTDRLEQARASRTAPGKARSRARPEVYVTVAGAQFKKPDMDVYFADMPEYSSVPGKCSCDKVGVVCSCNKVCTCNPQSTCGCVGYTSPCTCVGQTGGGGGGWCSCNKVCTCVPVH